MAVQAEHKTRKVNTTWHKGMPSPNPSGRPRRKILTTALVKALDRPWSVTTTEHGLAMVVRRLLEIIALGDDKHTIKSIELLWKYLEGAPQQAAEVDFNRALEDVAARTGAPVAWLRTRAREVAQRFTLLEGGLGDGQTRPVGADTARMGHPVSDSGATEGCSRNAHTAGAVAGHVKQRRTG